VSSWFYPCLEGKDESLRAIRFAPMLSLLPLCQRPKGVNRSRLNAGQLLTLAAARVGAILSAT
jgi:hypothetical protein